MGCIRGLRGTKLNLRNFNIRKRDPVDIAMRVYDAQVFYTSDRDFAELMSQPLQCKHSMQVFKKEAK